jgi:hypothetical protein
METGAGSRLRGPIDRMRVTAEASGGASGAEAAIPTVSVAYSLPIGEANLPLNPLIGRRIRVRYTGRIFCLHCGRLTRTSFAQGHCYRCMQSLAQCDMCIVRPETCHHHLGTCREPEWGTANCFVEHVVYLANSSGIKVGITAVSQMRTRWMDQGAIQALPIVRVLNRRDSGLVEFTLAKSMPDKTNWRLMLQGAGERMDLQAERDALFAEWPEGLPGEKLAVEEHRFHYPVLAYPAKPTTLVLEKDPEIVGKLLGIKGQYLIFDVGVINMRKYAGYELEWDCDPILPFAPSAIASKAEAATRKAAAPVVIASGASTVVASEQLSLF